MRALRKIIFINSAHIRYAEVRLDGNVHFIGTQGVGKSTLLRAILFFYNADKLHLGIPKEMKSFDEFYLPNANSYIVYEVEHEHGPFCILTFRSSGRACFRFIDAEYKKEWLIDDKGEVTAESKVIRERLGECFMSKIIDRYEQYRDILYGNKKAVSKDLVRFQIMETDRYQNIPRSIQNVFLNSRLDANFIKDIIIRSMNEEEANIDLGYFRRQVANFEQEYKDISCWYKLNKKGDSVVGKQAEAVVTAYHDLEYMKQQISTLCGELNYAVRMSRERLPLVGNKIGELIEQQSQQKRLLDELQQKYDVEKSSLNQKQGVVNEKLKYLKERKTYYAEHKIEEVLRRCSKEQILQEQLEGDKARLADLTMRFNDVTAKYKLLCQSVESQFEKYRQSRENNILNLVKDKQQAEGRMFAEHTKQCQEVDAAFSEKISNATNVIDQLKSEKNEIEKALLTLKYLQPYKAEQDALCEKLKGYDLREKELNGLVSTLEANISKLQTEYEKQEADIKSDYKIQLDAKQQEVDSVSAKVTDIDGLLARTKGSLYEWLEENKRDWERNIGKVINEERVLYQTGLHPTMDNGASLFGVKLDLTDMPVSVRKPTQLKEEKAERSKELNTRLLENANSRTKADAELSKVNADKQKQLDAEDKRYKRAKDEAGKLHEQNVAEIRADIKLKRQKTETELEQLKHQELDELEGRGADARLVEKCKASIRETEAELKYIESKRQLVFNYQRDKEQFFDHEDEFKADKKQLIDKLQQLSDKYNNRRQKHNDTLALLGKELAERRQEKTCIEEALKKADAFVKNDILCPPMLADMPESKTLRTPGQAVDELKTLVFARQERQKNLESNINVFKSNFSAKNTFNFRMEQSVDDDYLDFANNLDDFLINNKIEEYRRRTSERYVDILARVSKEMGDLTQHESAVNKIINDINNDFRERNFAGVIKLIALQSVPSSDKMVQLMKRIKVFKDGKYVFFISD